MPVAPRDTAPARRLRRRRRRRTSALLAVAYLVSLAGLSAACSWCYFRLLEAPALRLAAVEVKGLKRLSCPEVLATAGVSAGAPIFALDLHRLEQRLAGLDWVRSAEAHLRWGRRLEIRIQEKRPIALIRLDSLYYLDEDADLIKRLSPQEGMDFPVITGIGPPDFNNSRKLLCSRVMPLLARVDRYGKRRVESAGEISEVHVGCLGELALYTLDGLKIDLGERDCGEALRDAGRVIAELRRQGLAAQVAAVDAGCPARVFVKFQGHRPKVSLAAGGKAGGAQAEAGSAQAG